MPSYLRLKEQISELMQPTKTDIDLMRRVNDFHEMNRRCQETLIEIFDHSPYKIGDKIELIKNENFDKDHGWHCYNNLFRPGVPGEVVDLEIMRGKLYYLIKLEYLYYSKKKGPHDGKIVPGTYIPDEYKDPNIWYTSLSAACFSLPADWFKKI